MNLPEAIVAARAGMSVTVRCPAHEDRTPSLSVSPGHGRNVLLKCFAGCTAEAILAAAGLKWGDICEDKPLPRATAAPRKAPWVDPEAEAKRATWPPLEEPRLDGRPDEEIAYHLVERVATLRGLAVDGCRLAALRGLLRFCAWKGRLCWAVTDSLRINAQARRIDGRPWTEIHAKAWTLPGSRAAWPLGTYESRPFPVLLLVEGGPDLLAGHHFIVAQGRQSDVAVVGMLGASNRIPDDALPAFRGKRVRIFAHADAAGIKGAETWRSQLRSFGATVDVADFTQLRMTDGRTIGDLNDAVHVRPEDAGQLEDLIP